MIAEAQHLQVVAIFSNTFHKSFSQMCDTMVLLYLHASRDGRWKLFVLGLAAKLSEVAPEGAWKQFP